ncbi:MAG TPA: VOC family protein [Acetobacteraceae bacterium]|jgi:lactoylglutathione lyase|nr:VOC family protein [Acetobacteraceae bacterium]
MAQFASLGHVAIRAKDIDRSLAFYAKVGFPEMLRLFYDDGSLFLIYLRITDDQYLELFPQGVGDRAPGRDVTAVNHICITVEDIERTLAELARDGIALTRELKVGADGNRQAWIEDPDGNRIEIMEMARDSLQSQALKRLRAGRGPIAERTSSPRPLSFA